jgi:exopolyphosphatase / guanosine-5'-triphosphate,3'-diphosphate pyrophosphatase
MTEIVPRWEWRTFGEDFGAAEAHFARLPPERVQDSDETYLLSRSSNASVKVRDGLMDVKRLEAVDDDGLERWKPVMKAEYPLSIGGVEQVLTALGASVPSLARGAYTLDQLVDEVVGPDDDLQAVDVHKHREHFTVGGAMAELSAIRTAAGARRTIAVESEDPALVVAAVKELGLLLRPNVCLARGLKTLIGLDA